METIVKCFLGVSEQPVTQKTYASIDGTLLVDDIDDPAIPEGWTEGFPVDSGIFDWVRIPCQFAVGIKAVSLGSGGTGYTAGDILTIVQTGGSGGTIMVNTVDGSGVIQSITLLTNGSGYTVASGLAVTGGSGNSATVNILAIITSIDRDRVNACLGVVVPLAGHPAIIQKDIRLVVTIDGEDVTDGVAGTITITHNFNLISTFSLTLIDPKYSILKDSHIKANAVVIITVFINREKFAFPPFLVDTIKASRSKDFKLDIKGRDFGKKLVKKRMTLISVQDAASSKYRGSIIKYLAGQAGITKVNCPQGDTIITDHSFQDQFVFDMIQKEMEIEGWYIRFDEENVMQVQPRVKKTNADWNYGEREFIELGLGGTDQGIINKVIILGAIFEEEVITINENEVEDPDWTPEPDIIVNVTKAFVATEAVEIWSYTETVYATDDCKITVKYVDSVTPEGYIFPHYMNYRFTISGLGTIKSTVWTVTGGATIISEGKTSCTIQRERENEIESWPPNFTEKAFTIGIVIKVGPLIGSHAEWITDSHPEETITSNIKYTQIKATVQDAASIALYGELMPNKEGTLNYPLAETEAQCKRVGENVILDSHRFTKQPDEFVSCNPKLVIGNTIKLTDSKIGYNGENWIAEQIIYTFEINKETGAIKARTRVGCVFYA